MDVATFIVRLVLKNGYLIHKQELLVRLVVVLLDTFHKRKAFIIEK
jgi:hypothetical protein